MVARARVYRGGPSASAPDDARSIRWRAPKLRRRSRETVANAGLVVERGSRDVGRDRFKSGEQGARGGARALLHSGYATGTTAATASRMTAATAAGCDRKTACEAPSTSVTVAPARS